jgi:hypothetical protein
MRIDRSRGGGISEERMSSDGDESTLS